MGGFSKREWTVECEYCNECLPPMDSSKKSFVRIRLMMTQFLSTPKSFIAQQSSSAASDYIEGFLPPDIKLTTCECQLF